MFSGTCKLVERAINLKYIFMLWNCIYGNQLYIHRYRNIVWILKNKIKWTTSPDTSENTCNMFLACTASPVNRCANPNSYPKPRAKLHLERCYYYFDLVASPLINRYIAFWLSNTLIVLHTYRCVCINTQTHTNILLWLQSLWGSGVFSQKRDI